MAATSDSERGDRLAVERSLEKRDGYQLATVELDALSDVPLVVRLADEFEDGVDGVRVRPDAEPERWTVEPDRFVAETLASPDSTTTLAYEFHGPEPTPDSIVIEQAQPIDPADAAGALPQFRDALTFDGRAEDGIVPAAAEATDAQVRRAVEDITASRSRSPQSIEQSIESIDLADPE